MSKGTKKKGGKSKKANKIKKNPLFEKRPKSFRVGGDVVPSRDLTRFVKWPHYILLQRQKRILLNRLKVPPAIHQFSKTVEKSQALGLFKLLKKYSPETRAEKNARLLEQAKGKTEGQQPKDSKKPVVLKYGLNHVTTLIEEKKAKLVVIANDVDPIELVLWLPLLCKKQEVAFCFVKNKERLGSLVHKKNASCVALTEVRKEDQAELDSFIKNFKAAYNDNSQLRKEWGGGIVGVKSEHQKEKKAKALEKEALKKAGMK